MNYSLSTYSGMGHGTGPGLVAVEVSKFEDGELLAQATLVNEALYVPRISAETAILPWAIACLRNIIAGLEQRILDEANGASEELTLNWKGPKIR